MSIQALPTQKNIPLTLKATQFYRFATPAITVPFPSAYAQTQIQFAYSAVPTYAPTRVLSTIGGIPATAGISATTNSIAPGQTNFGQSQTGAGAGSSASATRSGLPVWAIGAIAGGGGAVVLVLLIAAFCWCTRGAAREKRRLKKIRAGSAKHENEKNEDDKFLAQPLNRSNSKKSRAPDGTKSTYFGVSGVSPHSSNLRNSDPQLQQRDSQQGRFQPRPIQYGEVSTEEPIFFPRAPMPIREGRDSLELDSIRTRSSEHERSDATGLDSPRRSWGTGNESQRDLIRREASENYGSGPLPLPLPIPQSKSPLRASKIASSPSRLSKSSGPPERYDTTDRYNDNNNSRHPPPRRATRSQDEHTGRRVGGPREMSSQNGRAEGYFNYEDGNGKQLGASAM